MSNLRQTEVDPNHDLQARLLLALADVNSDRRGQKKREEALRFVGQARSLSVDEADVGLQASSLAVMAKIFIKYKGDTGQWRVGFTTLGAPTTVSLERTQLKTWLVVGGRFNMKAVTEKRLKGIDQKACNKEALRLGAQALQLYEQTDDSRGRAISSHHCAIAQGNLGEMAASLQYINDSASFWRKAEDFRSGGMLIFAYE
eukprot:s1019_g18.t1